MISSDRRKKIRSGRESKRNFKQPYKTEEGMIHGGIDEDLALENVSMINYPKISESEGELYRYGLWDDTIRGTSDEDDLKYAYLRKKSTKSKPKSKRKVKKKKSCGCK